jgi:hypothetical protein
LGSECGGENFEDEKRVQNFSPKTGRETTLEDIGVDRRMILKWILNMFGGRVIGYAWPKDMHQWLSFVNTVVNFKIP